MKFLWQAYDSAHNFRSEYFPSVPGQELWVSNENAFVATPETTVSVNPVPRFYSIFAHLYGKDLIDEDILHEILSTGESPVACLENCLFHYLASLDMRRGLRLRSLAEYRLHRCICRGGYGQEVKDRYARLDEREQRFIQKHLICHIESGGRRSFFWQALHDFLPGCRVYFRQNEQKFLVCLPYEGTEEEKNIFTLLKYLFFDLGTKLEIFWGTHFGIIGEDHTMRMGEMIIYKDGMENG